MLFVEYPKCTTCTKAKKYLESQKADFTDRNIKLEKPTVEEIRTWHKLSGLPLRKLFNTSGMLYKQYDLKNKLDDMSDEEKYELLASDGMLVKRPILVAGDTVLFGFKAEEWEKAIK
ncbi:MAG: arsenate reductase family protein [Clostridia bacterium]|nr:arsenate reductase family protein [Clostridia bacterium]